ncbi:MAG: DegT/DnrJ/EryC1/StrS family aminotransferase [Chloroflexi bacterium]|nr:DegT/DnrJ/EryC1/StrS family aminotransferase [Chloroflexota bacterium]
MRIPVLRIPFDGDDRRFLQEGWEGVLDSGQLTLSKHTQEFEEAFREFSGTKYAVAVNSATAALEVILRALDVQDASVIVPTNTFLATALAAVHAGNRVIFADSDPATLALDPDDVARRITPDTRAVILVHIGGVITPRIAELKALCDERGLHLIEDCAHAHGCSIDGRMAGSLGVAGAFSFFPTKVLTTGEGGMVTTDDERVYNRVRMLRNQGKNPDLGNRISEVGHNFRMSELTALVGVQQMRAAPRLIEERRRAAAFYDAALGAVEGITPLPLPEGVESSYYKYVAYLDPDIDRAALKRTLRERYEVALTGEVYAELCHEEPLWERYTYCGRLRGERVACTRWPGCGCGEPAGDFPGARRISERHVCLPVYPGLGEDELAYVVESLSAALPASRVDAPASERSR